MLDAGQGGYLGGWGTAGEGSGPYLTEERDTEFGSRQSVV